MKFKEIVATATSVKTYVEKHKELPSKANGLNKKEYPNLLIRSVLNPKKDLNILSFNYAPNPTGDSINKTLTKKEFTVMVNDVNKLISPNKRLPNYGTYQSKDINIDLIVYCAAKIVAFTGKNNRLPTTCEFNSNVFKKSSSSKATSKGGTVCKALAKACGVTITDYNSLYKAFYYAVYLYYKNDCYSQAVALKRFAQKLGMNCADLGQLAFYALKELGYNVKIVRGVIKCDSGSFGHIWCRLTVNGKTINFDASAAAKGKSLGNMICGKIVEITDYNPSWAVSDDGRT